MRRRHLLLHRQRILLPRLLRHQPLVTYITGHQPLAMALGLRAVDAPPANGQAWPAVQPWWPLPADHLGFSQEEPVVSQAEEDEPELMRPEMSTTLQEEPGEPEKLEVSSTLQQGQPDQDRTRRVSEPFVEMIAEPPGETHAIEAEQVGTAPAMFQEEPGELDLRSTPARRVRLIITEMIAGKEKLPLLPLRVEHEPDTRREQMVSATGSAPGEHTVPGSASGSVPGEHTVSGRASEEDQSSEPVAEELFASRGSDRSPQAWLARLTRQARREAQAVSPPSPALESQVRKPDARIAESIAPSARTFLKPLLGIDPASVPVYRDAQAERATSASRADALSAGETIEMAPGHAQGTPETLGLLAHELTHVARQHSPRFIPPVLRPAEAVPSWETRDEETVALQVERQVRRAARGTQFTLMPAAPHQPANEVGETISPPDRGIWGNLPAPWEPLPAWLTHIPAPGAQASGPQPAPSLPTAPAFSAPSFVTDKSGGAEGGGKRRAGVERNVEESSTSETSTSQSNQPTPESPRAPEPDLDALARQVYSLLKRRLSVEQRREL